MNRATDYAYSILFHLPGRKYVLDAASILKKQPIQVIQLPRSSFGNTTDVKSVVNLQNVKQSDCDSVPIQMNSLTK